MPVLSRYLLITFLRHALGMMIALSVVFMIFDVLSNAEEVTQNTDHIVTTLWRYMGLRFPAIFVFVMPISAFLGMLSMMHKMVKSLEMVAIGGMGMTIYKIATILTIGGFLLAGLQFSISEYVASESTIKLRLWAAQDYQNTPPPILKSDKTSWTWTQDYTLHYDAAAPDGKILHDVTLIQRTEEGLIERYIRADQAVYDQEQWHLRGWRDDNDDDNDKEQIFQERLTIDLDLKPNHLSITAETFEEIRFTQLFDLVVGNKSALSAAGSRSVLYKLWFQRKLAQPLSIILMIFMAVPLGLSLDRQYNGLLYGFGFILVGFMFFIAEKLLFSLGESAALPLFLAIWAPLLIFGTMSLWFMLYKQK